MLQTLTRLHVMSAQMPLTLHSCSFIYGESVTFALRRLLIDLRSLKGTTTVRTFLKLCPLQLTRWDVNWTGYVE